MTIPKAMQSIQKGRHGSLRSQPPNVNCRLISLPFDVLLPIARRLDFASLVRFRSTCKTLATNSPLFSCASSVLQVLRAFDTGERAQLRQALVDSGHTVGSELAADGTAPWRMVCRRRLLEALMWKLVAQRNDDCQAWWSLVTFLYDPVTGPRPSAAPEQHAAANDLIEEYSRGRLHNLDEESDEFLQDLVLVAIKRQHSKGLTGLAAFCRSVHNWVQGLAIGWQIRPFVQTAVTRQQRGLTPTVPERVLIDIQLACLDLAWCGPKTDPVESWDDWFPITGGHPVVILTAMTQLSSDDIHDPGRVLDWFPHLLVQLFKNVRHHPLAYQLLDMYLLAIATLDNQALPNRVSVSFPKDLASMRHDIYRPLCLAGVSPTLFHSAIQALQRCSWASFEDWILFSDFTYCSISPLIIDWYLSRTPLHLRMLHNWCHELAGFAFDDYIRPELSVFPYFVEHLPFDLLDVAAQADRQRSLQDCRRCDQLRLVGQQSPDAGLRTFVDTSNDRVPPMSFLPSPLTHRRKLVQAIQTWLCTTPLPSPADVQPDHAGPNAQPDSTAGASDGNQKPAAPFTWRAYLTGFWRRQFSAGMIHLFWPNTRDSLLDPREDRLQVIPFADLMWAMLKGHRFDNALEVLKEARALVVGGKGGNPFLTWRYVAAEHESVSAIAAREEQFGLARVKQVLDEFWAFVAYVEKNGLNAERSEAE